MTIGQKPMEPSELGLIGARRVLLAALFIVLMVVDLAPTFAVVMTDGLWLTWVPEDFTMTLWIPLKPLLPDSYFYHYFGFVFYAAIRPAHWLTEWLLGSREMTIAYTQTYGTIIKVAFSAATLALAAGVLASRALPFRVKVATLLFMLTLLVADRDFYWILHGRASYALSFKLFVTVLLIATLVLADRALDGRTSGAGMTAGVGAIGGALFFDYILYFPLVAYPTLLILATTPPRLIPFRALLGVTTAIVVGLATLAAFYAGDVDSIISGASSHFAGLAAGNPMMQPGHYEQFYALFLDGRSVYFACHIILVAGAIIALATLIGCVASAIRHNADRTSLVVGLVLASHFANVGAYSWPMLKHGTNTTVFAATIETLFFIIVTMSVASGALRPTWSRRLARAISGVVVGAGAIIVAHDIAPGHTQWGPAGVRDRLVTISEIGATIRQFDDVLNELSDHYAVVDNASFYANDHVLFWQFRLSESFNNTAAGLGGPRDDRYNGKFQREYHPRYRIWEPLAVADVSDSCDSLPSKPSRRQWACYPLPFAIGTRYAKVYETAPPTPAGEAWIEPLGADIAAPVLADRLAILTMVSYPKTRGQMRAMLHASYPNFGVQGAPPGMQLPVGWNIVPLRTEDIARLGPIATKALVDHGYEPFLASVTGYRVAYYLLWLPTSR
jgi:hypothetical protein